MASYGRLPLLKRSVASALAQDHPDFEVLVVDDGSEEQTRIWLRSAQERHQRLRVVFQNHRGVSATRASGVALARGELICILDSDDILVPHAARRLTDELEERPDAVLVYSNIKEVLPNVGISVRNYRSFQTACGMLWATLLMPRLPFKHSGTTFRRHAALALGSYDSELPCKVDIDFYLKFLKAGHRLHLVPEPLVEFRRHKDSISRDRVLGLRVWFRLIDRYGPRNPAVRLGLKTLKAVSEWSKLVYMEIVS
jgi:glycosyltransferase involved in cell wall biosynthesis